MTNFSILQYVFIALLALVVEVRAERSVTYDNKRTKNEDTYNTRTSSKRKDTKETKQESIQYNIIYADDVAYPGRILSGPTPSTSTNTSLPQIPGYSFAEWAQIIGQLSPSCHLAPIRTFKELYIVSSLVDESVPNSQFPMSPVLVGVFKDPFLALDCQSFSKRTECLSDWKTFFGDVPAKQEFWAKDEEDNILEPDGRSVPSYQSGGKAPASVAGLAVAGPGRHSNLFDYSSQLRFQFAAIMCAIDKHSAFGKIPDRGTVLEVDGMVSLV